MVLWAISFTVHMVEVDYKIESILPYAVPKQDLSAISPCNFALIKFVWLPLHTDLLV